MQAHDPPPPSLSPPLITVFILFSASHLSSLHHRKEVKISHHKASSPRLARPLLTAIPSFYSFPHSYLSPHFLLSVLTSALLASTSMSCFLFFLFYLSIYLPLQNSHLAIIFSLYYSIGLPPSFPHLSLTFYPIVSLSLEHSLLFLFLSVEWKIKIFN